VQPYALHTVEKKKRASERNTRWYKMARKDYPKNYMLWGDVKEEF
jgi:hypothetical protein